MMRSLRFMVFLCTIVLALLDSPPAEAAPIAQSLSSPTGAHLAPREAAVPKARLVSVEAEGALNPKLAPFTLEELRDQWEQNSLRGPVVLMTVGSGMSVLFVPLAVYATLRGGFSTRPSFDVGCDLCPVLTAAAWGLATSGVALGIWGSFSLGHRIRARAQLSREIELREQIPRYREPAATSGLLLTHGPIAVPLGLGWGLAGTF